jgi:hypothetical protein
LEFTAEAHGHRYWLDLTRQSTTARASMTQPSGKPVTDSSRVTRGTWLDDGPATDLRHGANARR